LTDLEALAEALLDDIARRSGLPVKSLSADALDRLAAHDWPGNIRELRNVLEQAALMTDEPVLQARDLAAALGASPAPAGVAPRPAAPPLPVPALGPPGAAPTDAAAPAPIKPLAQAIAELEARAIRDALAATGGNKVAAARLLGIARATLYDKLPAA